MKNSGIEWIGEIPDSWKVAETKFLFDIFSGATPDTNSSVNWDGNINWITPADFKSDDVYVIKGKKSITTQGLNSCSAKLVPENSLIFSKRAPIGAVAITRSELCTNQGCLSCVNKGQVVTKYYYYVMRAAEEIYELYGAGTTFKEIAALKFANFILPYPSVSEQEAIQRDLSNRIKRVDKLIEVQHAQIDKLKEYKQSVIIEAVTKGLDPTVPMKDSGVEWIGYVNASYKIQNIRSIFTIRKEIIGREPETVLSITQSGLKIKSIHENAGQMADSYSNYQIVHVGDFAMNHMDLLTGGIGISQFEGVTSPDYRVFELSQSNMCAKYFLYIFLAYYKNKIFYAFGQGAANLGRWRLPAQNFYSIYIPVPDGIEQQQIADYLDDKCAKIDKLIAIKQAKIDKLQEYKKSLIYEYVTGKKEVVQ